MKSALRSLALTLAALLIATSCSHKADDILSAIPADTPLVVKADLEKASAALGLKEEDGRTVVPDWLPADMRDGVQALTALRRVVDTRRVFAVASKGCDDVILMAAVTDAAALETYLDRKGRRLDKAEGALVWSLGDACILLDGALAYVSSEKPEKTAAFIKAAREATLSLADCDGVARALTADNMLCIAATLPMAAPDKNHGGGVYSVTTADVRNQSLYGTARSIYADGAPFAAPWVKDIDMAALQYVPGNAMAVMAMGLDGAKIDAEAVAQAFGFDSTDPMEAAQLAMAMSYVKRIDGTVVAAASPRMRMTPSLADILAGDDLWAAFDYTVMVRLSQESLAQTVAEIETLLQQSGMPWTREGNGLFRVDFMGRPVWIGNVDSYLVASTAQPSNDNGSSLAARFEGKTFGLRVDIPVLGIVADNPEGLSLDATSGASEGSYSLSFTNSSEAFFEALAKIVKAL